MVKITTVEKGSLAEKKRLKPDDILVSINGNEINDVLDYRFYLADTKIVLLYERGGKTRKAKIKKDEYDDIGLDFETPLMDKKQRCKNGCIFCFIDQLPKGLREPLYFKDDDSRLSFLHGNYITLTNMTDKDVERIVKMRFSPLNLSIHTTNPTLRVEMMKNKRAGEVLKYLRVFKDAGLDMCGQIVLCKGVNDGEELMRSMRDLSEYFPELKSVSVVPVGLTRYRDGLYPLEEFSPDEAAAVVDMIEGFAEEHKSKFGSRLFFAADEFYLKCKREIPSAEHYEGYPQIENGVGMIRAFLEDAEDVIASAPVAGEAVCRERIVSVATGVAAYPVIKELCSRIEGMDPTLRIHVYEIKNNFFGEKITVSGLLTGEDLYSGLKDKELGEELLIPANCLRPCEQDFLCGMTLSELSDKLGIKIRATDAYGCELAEALLKG